VSLPALAANELRELAALLARRHAEIDVELTIARSDQTREYLLERQAVAGSLRTAALEALQSIAQQMPLP
jgi:hypothetical protein